MSSEVNGNASDDICYDSLLDDIDCVELSESYIERQRTALEQVSKLLSEFENFTSYYPTYSLMREDADKLFIGTDYRLKVKTELLNIYFLLIMVTSRCFIYGQTSPEICVGKRNRLE